MRSRGAALAAAAIAVAGCGGARHAPPASRSPTPAPAARPALCGPLRTRVIAHVDASALTEASGLVLARGMLWTHDDSGGPATLFALSTRGRLLRELPLPGATNVDWEDIAARGRTLYVGDIGDNAAARQDIAVYRVTGTAAQKIALRYPDGPHDAEALLVERSGALVIVTKSFSGEARVYTGRSGTLRRAGSLQLGIGEAVTGGDSAGDTVVLRTYDRAFVYTGTSIVRALRHRPCTAGASLLSEGQGEALALAPDGRSFYTLPEGAKPALREYVSRH